MVAAGASLSHLALRLPGRAQQLGFVPLPLSAGAETLQEKIHSVLKRKLVKEERAVGAVTQSTVKNSEI